MTALFVHDASKQISMLQGIFWCDFEIKENNILGGKNIFMIIIAY